MASRFTLSILIPVYNWDISPLLRVLGEQRRILSEPDTVEIIAVDDGSSRRFENSVTAGQLDGVLYKELPGNTGRASVRNHLVGLAQGAYVLFLDADMLPDRKDFIQQYLDLAGKGKQVVCGGISYQQVEYGASSTSFHLYKSMKTEALPAAKRNKQPWRYVFTSNTLIRKDILDSVEFDPRFVSYGFEDIEWAMRLSESYRIEHVDNTCTHMGLMDMEQLFARMRESVENYYQLHRLYPEKTASVGAVGPARYLSHIPDVLLMYCDKLTALLFFHVSWNGFRYILFQADKVILLARKLQKGRRDSLQPSA